MVDWIHWSRSQLQASADHFVWALSRIDPHYHFQRPDLKLGEWPPARHIWHVTEYERYIGLPSMQQWLGSSVPDASIWRNDEAAWLASSDARIDELVARFRDVRQQQIDLLDQLTAIDWETPRETIWGSKPLSMVVIKTYQHSLEHENTLLRMGLWWAELERKQEEDLQ